jgi:hypothetical protein
MRANLIDKLDNTMNQYVCVEKLDSITGVARFFCWQAKFARKIELRAAKKLNKKIGLVFEF